MVNRTSLRNMMLSVAMAGALSALAGCDDQQSEQAVQKLKEFFNAVKPDALLLKGLTPGITTEAQIRDQMGKPETERQFTDASNIRAVRKASTPTWSTSARTARCRRSRRC